MSEIEPNFTQTSELCSIDTDDAATILRTVEDILWDERVRVFNKAGVDPLETDITPSQSRSLGIAARWERE